MSTRRYLLHTLASARKLRPRLPKAAANITNQTKSTGAPTKPKPAARRKKPSDKPSTVRLVKSPGVAKGGKSRSKDATAGAKAVKSGRLVLNDQVEESSSECSPASRTSKCRRKLHFGRITSKDVSTVDKDLERKSMLEALSKTISHKDRSVATGGYRKQGREYLQKLSGVSDTEFTTTGNKISGKTVISSTLTTAGRHELEMALEDEEVLEYRVDSVGRGQFEAVAECKNNADAIALTLQTFKLRQGKVRFFHPQLKTDSTIDHASLGTDFIVNNIAPSMEDNDLLFLLQPFGNAHTRFQKGTGKCIVSFPTKAEARVCASFMDGYIVRGVQMSVTAP